MRFTPFVSSYSELAFFSVALRRVFAPKLLTQNPPFYYAEERPTIRALAPTE